MLVTIGMFVIFLFVVGSMAYVYRYRGQARYENLSEYLRKGWPLFTPLNCLLYMFTEPRASKPIMDTKDFSELNSITQNWKTIREEVLGLYNQGYFNSTSKTGSAASFDIGFRTFFKYGWSKFYLTWYGYTHNSAKMLCPKTVEILEKVPSVNGAMFSLLPAGSKLTRHLDPVASSLRYHLGLATPNSDKCFISIDDTVYSWRDGEALLFDETYIHHAKNDAENYRLILMCDIERPMSAPGRFVNFLYKGIAKLTVVPNLEGDKRGFANIVFSSLSPMIQNLKNLKQTNKGLYLVIKYSINLTLIVIFFALIAALLNVINSLITTT